MKPEGRINNKVCLKLIDPDAPASLFNSVWILQSCTYKGHFFSLDELVQIWSMLDITRIPTPVETNERRVALWANK